MRESRFSDEQVVAVVREADWVRSRRWPGATGVSEQTPDTWRKRGHKACRDGRSGLYHRVPHLFEAMALARGDGHYARLHSRIRSRNPLRLLVF